MSYLDRIRAANAHDLRDYLPFSVGGTRFGCVKTAFAEILTRWPEVFRVDERRVTLAPALDASPARQADRRACRRLHGRRGGV